MPKNEDTYWETPQLLTDLTRVGKVGLGALGVLGSALYDPVSLALRYTTGVKYPLLMPQNMQFLKESLGITPTGAIRLPEPKNTPVATPTPISSSTATTGGMMPWNYGERAEQIQRKINNMVNTAQTTPVIPTSTQALPDMTTVRYTDFSGRERIKEIPKSNLTDEENVAIINKNYEDYMNTINNYLNTQERPQAINYEMPTEIIQLQNTLMNRLQDIQNRLSGSLRKSTRATLTQEAAGIIGALSNLYNISSNRAIDIGRLGIEGQRVGLEGQKMGLDLKRLLGEQMQIPYDVALKQAQANYYNRPTGWQPSTKEEAIEFARTQRQPFPEPLNQNAILSEILKLKALGIDIDPEQVKKAFNALVPNTLSSGNRFSIKEIP